MGNNCSTSYQRPTCGPGATLGRRAGFCGTSEARAFALYAAHAEDRDRGVEPRFVRKMGSNYPNGPCCYAPAPERALVIGRHAGDRLPPPAAQLWWSGMSTSTTTRNRLSTANTIGAFDRHADGTLTPEAGSPFAAGGAGTGSGLASQGALQFSADGRFLIALDAGSSQISVLRVHSDGSLSLVPGGVVSSRRIPAASADGVAHPRRPAAYRAGSRRGITQLCKHHNFAVVLDSHRTRKPYPLGHFG